MSKDLSIEQAIKIIEESGFKIFKDNGKYYFTYISYFYRKTLTKEISEREIYRWAKSCRTSNISGNRSKNFKKENNSMNRSATSRYLNKEEYEKFDPKKQVKRQNRRNYD